MRRDPRATARMRGCFALVAKQCKPFAGKKNTEYDISARSVRSPKDEEENHGKNVAEFP